MENINLKDDHKIELMMGVLAFVYLIAIKEGLLRHQNKPIAFKKYKNGKTYLSISIFRMGMSIMLSIFSSFKKVIRYIDNLLKSSNIIAFILS